MRVCNEHIARNAMRRGGVVLIVNHPSLIETLVLPSLFWWQPRVGKPTWRPWSIADAKLFGKRGAWLYPGFHCVPVHRSACAAAENKRAMRRVLEILRSNGVVIVYPEGGRTCKGTVFHTDGSRVVRACDPSIVRIAQRVGATVIPVWVEHGRVTTPESFVYGFGKLLRCPMTVTFGEAMHTRSPATTRDVADALLRAGREHRGA